LTQRCYLNSLKNKQDLNETGGIWYVKVTDLCNHRSYGYENKYRATELPHWKF
jgi:hypothetical protein